MPRKNRGICVFVSKFLNRLEEKIRKELAQSIADDLDFYDFEQDVTRGGKLK